MSEHVLRGTDAAVLTLRLARPEKKNALTRPMYASLTAALTAAATDPAVRVVLLAGGTDFTAGNDMADFAAPGADPAFDTQGPGAFDFLEALIALPKPVVAAVRGVAIGIGTTMLLHCDAVVAAREARLQMPFTRIGIVPEAGSSVLLAATVGRARANWLLLSGEPIDGAAAEAMGLVARAVPDAEVEATAAAMTATLAALPPGAVVETKRLLRAPERAMLSAQMTEERRAVAARLRSPETQAIVAAFLARRTG